MNSPCRAAVYLPAAAFLVIIGILTLRPLPGQAFLSHATPWWCLLCGALGTVDVLLNILLFVPFGLTLRLAGFRLGTLALVGLATSVLIEALQWQVVAGRDASLSDVMTNSLGTALGGLVASSWRMLVHPEPGAARRLALVGAISWALIWWVSGRLLQPSPPVGEYWGQWAHDFDDRGQWGGRVLGVDINGVPIPDGQVPSPPIEDALRSGNYTFAVETRSGPLLWKEAQIFGLATGEGEIFLEWAARGRDLSLRLKHAASDLRIRSPRLRLEWALPTDSGVPLTLVARQGGGMLSAEVRTPRGTEQVRHQLTPSLNWTFLLPFNYGWGFETRWVTMLWLMVTIVPLAWWGSRTRSVWYALGAPALAVGFGLGLAPLLTGLPPVSWSEWVGAALGAAAGWSLGRYPPSARRADSP